MTGRGPAPAGAPAALRWRALFAATLLLAMAAGTLPQFVVGVLAPFITADLGLSRAQLGALTTVFFAVGTLVSPFAGRLVDRVGGRTTLLALFWIAAVGVGGMGASRSFAELLVAVVVAGLALALANPVTNLLIAVHVPRGRQGIMTGVKQSGVQAGGFLVGLLLPVTALAIGWRGAVLLAASLGLVGALASRFAVSKPTRDGPPTAPAAGATAPVSSFVRWLAAYAFLMGAGVAAVSAFVVLYAVEELGLGEGRAGLVAALIAGVGVGARILWGRAAERMATSSAPLLVLAATSVVAQVLVWAAATAGEWLLWVGAIAFGATAASWNAVGMLAIVREMRAGSTGRASGTVQSAFYAGLVVCPILFGASVDATSGYDLGWAGVTVVFGAATVLAAVWHARHR